MDTKKALSSEFILELFKVTMKDQNVFEIVREHMKYSFLPFEHEKKFWKKCVQLHTLNNKVPTLGLVQVECRKDERVKEFIAEIKQTDEPDADAILISFQDFIKESKFVELFEESGALYNRGEQSDAYKIFIKGAEDLAQFSIRDRIFKKVFADFEDRNLDRKFNEKRRKVPFMIDLMDAHTHGGPETGECILFTAESGVGKSQALIHYAIQTARRGGRVALFQIEGTERQVMDRLDAAWTGALYHDVKNATMEPDRVKKIKKIIERIKGEIYVEAFEKFGSASIHDVRASLKDMKKLYGEFDLVVIDYLELLEIGDGMNYGSNGERFRQQKIGRFMKELAMEDDVVVCTATQASNLPSELKKDPNFVMTREFLSEDKGKIRPFDYHYTFNQTFEEYRNKDAEGNDAPIIRIYEDKIREYKGADVVAIITNFSRSRFYDKQKTIRLINDYEDEE